MNKFMGLLVIGIVIFIFYEGETTTDNNNKSIDATPSPSMRVDATTILAEYENNEIAADEKYKGRWIEINGVIENIGKTILDSPYITLGNDNSSFSIKNVQAFFETKDAPQLARLAKGDNISVVCLVRGLIMNVLVKKCIIQAE